MFTKTPLPKISCLMVTAAGRLDTFRQSLRCYVDQTYPNRELLVVNEGPREYQHQLDAEIQRLDRKDIHPVWLDGDYSLGALRNISIGFATGSIICQWDDDDLSMPQRLSVQYSFLSRRKARVCYLSDQLHYYYPNRQLYWDNWQKFHSGGERKFALIPGTLMAYRDINVRYPSSGQFASAGEDSIFADKLLATESVTLLGGQGHLHVYTYHGVNQVFDLGHHLDISQLRSQTREDITKNRHLICEAIRYLRLEGEVNVMCRDGLAFKYEIPNGR